MNMKSTKKGVASFYIVIFATIIFGVITLSFMRIILSEAGQSSDDDLSRSAYDSAMAGVEDAKTAVNRYYDCISNGGNATTCNRATLFRDNCDSGNGIGLAEYLYGYTGGEVAVQPGGENSSDQAYTCVTISDEVPDYRGTLSSDTRTKIVPLRVNDASVTSTQEDVTKVRFRWYSVLNEGNDPDFTNDGRTKLADKNNATVPPTIQLTYVKMSAGMTISDLQKANNNAYYSTIILMPNQEQATTNVVTEYDLRTAGNISKTYTASMHDAITVACSKTGDFACTVELEGTRLLAGETAFLVVSLPYGEAATDFVAELLNRDGSTIPFLGVQLSVDSTGRTNQLVRRVETRLDRTDLFFPYPQYEMELSGGGGNTIDKNFWITTNCWYHQPTKPADDPGRAGTCNNNGDVAE